MNRRVFLSAVTGGLLAAPLAVASPPGGKPERLGLLYGIKPTFDPVADPVDRALVGGLRAHGYEPGRNIIFEFRSGEGHPERLPGLAAELVRLN
jgi:putative ABC transport system substrate-binding protein